ncbi:unnamed protein product, partial [Pelagomonas calceolata]
PTNSLPVRARAWDLTVGKAIGRAAEAPPRKPRTPTRQGCILDRGPPSGRSGGLSAGTRRGRRRGRARRRRASASPRTPARRTRPATARNSRAAARPTSGPRGRAATAAAARARPPPRRSRRRRRPGGARDLAPRAVRDRDVQHEPRGGDGRRRRLEPVQRRPGGARQALRRRAQDPAADAALDAAPLDLGRARDELAHERRHLARVAVPVLGREREDRQLRDAAAQAPVDDLAELARAGRVALEPPLGPERARAEASVAVHDDGDVPRRRPRRV